MWSKDNFKHHSPGIISCILTISCMIINGDTVIRQKLAATTDSRNNNQLTSSSTVDGSVSNSQSHARRSNENERPVNENFLTQVFYFYTVTFRIMCNKIYFTFVLAFRHGIF